MNDDKVAKSNYICRMKKLNAMYKIPEDCDDDLVLISPGYLIEEHGFKKKAAVKGAPLIP